MTLTESDLRHIARWAAACASRALPLFEAASDDTRPRDAIEGARVFARGGKRTAQLRSLALAALAAARDVGDPVAAAAARAAGLAAATAYMHPLATADQAKHMLAPPAYVAQARALSDDPSAAAKEIRWAVKHAGPAVRDVLRRMPARDAGRGGLNALLYQLDAGIRR